MLNSPRLQESGVHGINPPAFKPPVEGHARKFKTAGRFRDAVEFYEGREGHGGIVTDVSLSRHLGLVLFGNNCYAIHARGWDRFRAVPDHRPLAGSDRNGTALFWGDVMRKLIVLALAASLCGCGNQANIDGKVYDTYGLLNKDDNRNEAIQYRLITGNVVWSVLLCETIVAPIYFIGFSIYEPVGKKGTKEKGVVQ